MKARHSKMATGMAKVIVATEQEFMVRIYVGVPEHDGMEQAGQFMTRSAIDPTALANMAVDLASQFGWLNGNIVSESPAINGKTKMVPDATIALPIADATTAAKSKGVRGSEMVRCGTCRKVMRRDNLARHLINVHKATKTNAYATTRKRPAIDAPAETPAETPAVATHSAGDSWKAKIRCPIPGCEQIATRSNLARHLESTKPNHGLRHSDAANLVRTLPAIDGNPPSAQRKLKGSKHNRQGLHGARILEMEILPGVLNIIRTEGPITSADLAKRYDVNTGTALAWLKKLEAKGDLIDVSESNVVGQARTYAVPEATIGTPIDQTTADLLDIDHSDTRFEFAGQSRLPSDQEAR